MRQSDGSELLGPGNPHSADVGVIYVEPTDSRPEILKAINTQEITGRKQIAIVLLDSHKAFRQPVDFDGLKNLRRGLKAQLVFIAPSGPGPANFARQRNFPVYSSLDSFKQALLTEGVQPVSSARMKSKPGGLLGLGSRRARPSSSQRSPVTSPAPPLPGSQGRGNQSRPASPLTDLDTVELAQANQQNVAPPPPAGPKPGAPFASGLESDDDALYQPMPPLANPPLPTPTAQGSSTASSSGGPTRRGDSKPLSPGGPNIIAFPSIPPATPTTTGKMGSQSRTSAKLAAVQNPQNANARGSGKLAAAPAPGAQNPQSTNARGSGKLAAAPAPGAQDIPAELPVQGVVLAPGPQNVPVQPATSNDSQTGSGKIAAVAGTAAVLGAGASLLPGPVAPIASSATGTKAPGASPPISGSGNIGSGQRPSGLTPLPPPRPGTRRRRRWRRTLLLVILLLLLCSLLVYTIISASSGKGLAGIIPASTTAQITITPASKLEQNGFVIVGKTKGTPDPTKNQVAARVPSDTSPTQSATGNATGSIPATTAHGTLTFQNVGNSSVQLAGGTLTGGDGVEINFGPVFVPATGSTIASINGEAAKPGAAGNIKAFDLDGACCGYSTIFVKNQTAFTGGRDAVTNQIIQQSDIDKAANTLIPALKADVENSMQKQILSNERVVDNSFNCDAPAINANHKVGDQASSVTVQVSVTCTEEVYDYQGANKIAVTNLKNQAAKDFGPNSQYALDGQIVTSLLSSTNQVSANQQISIVMQAEGLWVYQFTQQAQQNIKQALLKLSKNAAQNVLLHYMGIASDPSPQITLSSGNTMPSAANDITLTIRALPGAQLNATPTGTQGTPGTINTPSLTPTATPIMGGS